MSKSVKMIVGVVAAVAIPFAAPALAGMLAASAATGALAGTALGAGIAGLGTTATSALVGAGLGAASSAATGGDVGRGALFGALGGGLGGLAKAGQAAQAAQGTQAATTSQGFNAATSAQGLAADAAAGLAPQGFAGGAVDATAAGLSSGLSSSGAGAGVSALDAAYASTSPAAMAQSAQQGMTAGVAAPQPTSFGDRFVAGVKDSWGQMTSPENLSRVALEGGKYVAGSLAAGTGMTSAEEAMMRAQRQEMRRAQEANEAAFNTRRDEALKLIREADYFDPNYMGLQRARDAQLQSARAKRAGLRGLDAPARQAEGRRYDLGTARATGSAYDEGYQSGVTARNQTRTAGLAALPTGYQTTTGDYTALATQSNLAEERRRQRARDIGNLFGDFSGTRKAQETGA